MSNFWIIIAGIAGIILVIFAAISTFHLFGSDTQQQPIVIVKVNNTVPSTGNGITSATTDTTNGKTTVNLSSSSSLVDDFYADTSLNQLLWVQNGQQFKSWATSGNFKIVSSYPTFQSSGMDVGSVKNQFDMTGIETTNDYSPPFTITTQFQGPTALFDVGTPSKQNYIQFGGTSIGSCDIVYQYGGISSWPELKTTQQIPNWCTVKIIVDALGTGTLTLEDKSVPISIGKGPFHILIAKAQYIQNPDNQPTFWRYVHLIPNNTP